MIPPAYAQTYAQAAAAKGADVTLVMSPGADHFDVIDPDGHAWGVTRAWLGERLRLWRSTGA